MSNGNRTAAVHCRICCGVDLSGSDSEAVKARRRGRRIIFEQFKSYKAGEAIEICDAKDAVAAALPVALGIVVRVKAPFDSVSKSKKVLSTLLDIQLPFPLEECEYHFAEIKKVRDGVEALGVVARRADIEQRLRKLAQCGVDPHVLDFEGLALWTGLLREQGIKDDGIVRVAVYMRADGGVLAIGRGLEFVACHRITTAAPGAVNHYLKAQFNKLGLRSAADTEAVEWYLDCSECCPVEIASELRRHISESWQGEVRDLSKSPGFMARELAVRALTSGPLRVNLRSGGYTHPGIARQRDKSVLVTILTVMLAGIVMCAAAAAWQYKISSERQSIRSRFVTKLSSLLGYKVRAQGRQGIIIAQRELENRRTGLSPLLETLKPSLLQDLRRIVGDAAERDVKIGHLVLAQPMIEMTVDCEDSSASRFAADMRKAGYQVTVKPVSSAEKRRRIVLKRGGDE